MSKRKGMEEGKKVSKRMGGEEMGNEGRRENWSKRNGRSKTVRVAHDDA